MAKTMITRTCGHTETVNISGPVKGREGQERYEASKCCAACYATRQAAARQTANAAAAVQAQAAGLPALTGSDKQTAWAVTIRQTCISAAAAMSASSRAAGAGAMADRLDNAMDSWVASHTAAAYWIDRRDWTHVRSDLAAAHTAQA